ncbi:MAG TPA: CHAT domain-containing protein [Gemmatimonadaceae bacterium]|nr:CHAT domain-containing protein [Gemmatimonadaceae bacterium]
MRDEARGPLLRALGDGSPLPRRWGARLSLATAYARCGDDSTAAGGFPAGLACPASGPVDIAPDVAALAGRARTAVASGADADALHALAVIDLVWADGSGKALDRSIQYLEMATRLVPSSPSAFVDLSAARLARAARRADAREILLALDAATRAVALQPRDAAARFDRALALDLLGLDEEAAKEWRAYLAADSTSGWAAEARRRLASRAATTPAAAPATLPDADAPADSLAAFATRAAAEARSFAWERLLGEWARATLDGDTARARVRLAAASSVGAALAREHGDSSIADAVRAIDRAASDRAATRRLARVHDRFARAQVRTRANDYAAADSAYAAILAERPPSPALLAWTTYGHGNALIYDRGRASEGERVIASLVRRTDDARHPALAARALWALGVLHLRAGRHDAGLDAVRRAQTLFARLGEAENYSAMVGLEGEARLETGDDVAGYSGLCRALLALRAYPTSVWRHNVLLLLARATAADGLERATMSIEDEDAAAAAAAGRPVTVVESRIGRASALWTIGSREQARVALDDAARMVASLPPGDARGAFDAELDLAVATGPLRDQPRRARPVLDSVVSYFAPSHRPAKLIPALVARADAAIALGDARSAEADLAAAASLYDAQRAEMASLPQRAALLASARSVFDGLAMLRLREGRAADALDAIERGRSSFAATRPHAARDGGAARDALVVDYAVIGDTLLAWVVDEGSTTLTRTIIDRVRLAETVERARTALELGAPEVVLRPDLSLLYEWLVRPIESRLGGAGRTVAVVADGEIGDVPFAALYDARSGRYLVERFATRLVATLHDGLSGAAPAAAPDAALFVTNPALDWRAYPTLSPLAAAETEVRESAALYGRPTFLGGAAADSASVLSALGSAELFHFAGHAVLHDWRPERSFLAVAPHGLTAPAIAALDLHRLRLVVLSACETMRSSERRSGAFTSFTEAFLAAGARGVVGSLWRVNDAPTATLMRDFHRAYRRSGDPASALRDAQLALLHAPDATLRSPASWGAFRYAGR